MPLPSLPQTDPSPIYYRKFPRQPQLIFIGIAIAGDGKRPACAPEPPKLVVVHEYALRRGARAPRSQQDVDLDLYAYHGENTCKLVP